MEIPWTREGEEERERGEGLRKGFGRRERGFMVVGHGLFGLGRREREEEEKVVVAAMDDLRNGSGSEADKSEIRRFFLLLFGLIWG